MKIGERTFSVADQQLFARVSRDVNPMHMDAVAARRLVTARQVVHGIHLLLAAIEFWQRRGVTAPPGSLECTFSSPVSVGDRVVFTQRSDSADEIMIEASVEGVPCARITMGPGRSSALGGQGPGTDIAGRERISPGDLTHPLDESAETQLRRAYAVTPNPASFEAEFSGSYRALGPERFAALAALSYFVGMICPGLHSIFSSLSLDLSRAPRGAGELLFLVQKYDARVGLFDIAIHGCVEGTIKAFRRQPPQAQPGVSELARHVAADEFRGTRSLIIGGSRGLGEFTAKLLAAGGGDVVITYAMGADDAARVRGEIVRHGAGACEVVKADLSTDSFDWASLPVDALTMVYYFATPRIYRRKAHTFDVAVFQEFCRYYVDRFHEMCACLEASASQARIMVYCPSSVYVAERPKAMTEYAMAKAAAEVLAEDINRSFKKVSVLSTRLPRLTTDQTASIIKVPAGSSLDALLPVVRAMRTQA